MVTTAVTQTRRRFLSCWGCVDEAQARAAAAAAHPTMVFVSRRAGGKFLFGAGRGGNDRSTRSTKPKQPQQTHDVGGCNNHRFAKRGSLSFVGKLGVDYLLPDSLNERFGKRSARPRKGNSVRKERALSSKTYLPAAGARRDFPFTKGMTRSCVQHLARTSCSLGCCRRHLQLCQPLTTRPSQPCESRPSFRMGFSTSETADASPPKTKAAVGFLPATYEQAPFEILAPFLVEYTPCPLTQTLTIRVLGPTTHKTKCLVDVFWTSCKG